MNATVRNRPVTVFVLLALLVFLGLGGLAGGVGMVMDPSGEGMGLPLNLLDSVPVDDFLLPGLFLVTVLGILPLFAAYGVWARPAWAPLQRIHPWRDYHWSWGWSRVIAVVLILWVGLEFLMWGSESSPLQVIYLAVGLAILVMCGYPSIRRYLWVGEEPEIGTESGYTAGSPEETE